MMKDRIFWFGRYEGWLRMVAHGVKDGDADCIELAAKVFDLMLPNECVVIPMPSHEGTATEMRLVAERVCSKSLRRKLADILVCEPHESNYIQKKSGFMPAQIFMRSIIGKIDTDLPIFIIDNCIVSGVTASSALRVFPQARICALAASSWR